MKTHFRVGQIVPSSNTTMEVEIPALLGAHSAVTGTKFSFHSSRMRMRNVTKVELAAMDVESDRCALELSDARMDVMGYACLVAIMSAGAGYHRESQNRLHQKTVENGGPAPVISSAGALIDGLQALGAKKIALIAPYMKPLTQMVVDYIESEGIEVQDRIALEVPDNLAVGLLDPARLPRLAKQLNTVGVDAIVLSACVQMPSLPSVELVERSMGIPVVSAAVCTAFRMLESLGLPTVSPNAGSLLSGLYQSKPVGHAPQVT